MNVSRFVRFDSSVHRLGMVVVGLVAVLGIAGSMSAGCLPPDAGGGGEGDRCNPLLSHNECGSGLSCTQPTDCPENYCCPADNPTSPFCQKGCAGGAYSIAVAGFYGSCATSTPSSLCSCFNPPIFAAGTDWALQVDAGPECFCLAEQDPVECLANFGAEAGAPEAGVMDATGN
jgi:hypothetical protein